MGPKVEGQTAAVIPPPKGKRSWLQVMNSSLKRDSALGLEVLDLFCGAGGLSLGFWACGFDVRGIDYSADAVRTYALNMGDADCADLTQVSGLPRADVIVAGPPCQPWSRAGKRLGEQDERDGLAITMQAVQRMMPLAAVIENVPELARAGRRRHLDDFKAELVSLEYAVSEHILNAADYGVPQNRRRVFITAIQGERPLDPPTVWSRTVSVRQAIPGTYGREAAGTQLITDGMSAYIERYERASGCRTPRDLHADRPARTLTVRNLSGATGDMMRLRLPDGRRRTLTVREAARMQSFPDWFRFHGTQRSQLEQIGNAVPSLLAFSVADTVRRGIVGSDTGKSPPDWNWPTPSSASASATMRANRRRDTTPERTLRSTLHRLGWRFRVDHQVETTGRRVRPDIVFTRRRVAVFVDGCFWHSCPEHGQQPRANAPYWQHKLRMNAERDRADTNSLKSAGWTVLRVWEHEPAHDAAAAIQAVLESR